MSNGRRKIVSNQMICKEGEKRNGSKRECARGRIGTVILQHFNTQSIKHRDHTSQVHIQLDDNGANLICIYTQLLCLFFISGALCSAVQCSALLVCGSLQLF